VTTAIKSSLTKLNDSLQQLEISMSAAAKKKASAPAKVPQNDLFSIPANNAEAKALANRLDGAIAKVERLLREEAHG
jgi:hypothetical protein